MSESSTAEQACTHVWRCVMELATQAGVTPMRDKIWTCKVDDTWTIKVNGYRVAADGIPPFHLAPEYNGWPAGLIGPLGDGVIAAGEGANIWTLRDALLAKCKQRKEAA